MSNPVATLQSLAELHREAREEQVLEDGGGQALGHFRGTQGRDEVLARAALRTFGHRRRHLQEVPGRQGVRGGFETQASGAALRSLLDEKVPTSSFAGRTFPCHRLSGCPSSQQPRGGRRLL